MAQKGRSSRIFWVVGVLSRSILTLCRKTIASTPNISAGSLQGKQVTRLDPETPFPIHLSGRRKQQKSEKNEECRFEVRQCSDPRNDFRVNRVNCKNQRTNAGNAAVVE